jgi:hypothetical protein
MVTLTAAEVIWLYWLSAALVAVMVHVVEAAPGAIDAGVITPVVALTEHTLGVLVAKVTIPVPKPPVEVTTLVTLVSAMTARDTDATSAV